MCRNKEEHDRTYHREEVRERRANIQREHEHKKLESIKKRRQSRSEADRAELQRRKVAEALNCYYSDKPWFMDDEDIVEELKKHEVHARDVVRATKRFRAKFGADTRACVCALCNDYTVESEGSYKYKVLDELNKLDLVCDEETWESFTQVEKTFRHVEDLKKETDDGPQRYYISTFGLQNRIDDMSEECDVSDDDDSVLCEDDNEGEWRWWTDKNEKIHNIATARMFICCECSGSREKARFLKNSDPGRMPLKLQQTPLRPVERIILNKYVVYHHEMVLSQPKTEHVSGHVMAIPTFRSFEQPEPSVQPNTLRKEYAEYIHITYIGEKQSKQDGRQGAAHELKKQQTIPYRIVRPEVVELWMEYLDMQTELEEFRKNRADYIAAWEVKAEKFFNNRLESSDATVCSMHRNSAIDIARARPGFDQSDQG